MSIENHSGSKYIRRVYDCIDIGTFCQVDVYAILKAFNVTDTARQHAIKKLLAAGLREKVDEKQDLLEARDAISRSIEMFSENKTK